ncbi:hypothetical protein HanRHA438_Chr09g0404481 [Helianthus annuus]|nr:hypothetical protein HanHA300_Chr09g0322371 [Helianthus annuus]KAJ0534788.1 hypothetical protein HanIR_Chr09g0423571 [Helianthus annuus]KAJ0542760.1 hypothetical protein HanHA89_Chr09g0343291 [Helianthus annuus]KAJ0707824.1 hypothetical protein HanLR1_Chr09g0322671 [Helianthus annuus]KAJ0711797.1 hypothetical protein HanOQP8_Chr09g0327761 [Helianthus annuus]
MMARFSFLIIPFATLALQSRYLEYRDSYVKERRGKEGVGGVLKKITGELER